MQVEQDGWVTIVAYSNEALEAGLKAIRDIVAEIETGTIYRCRLSEYEHSVPCRAMPLLERVSPTLETGGSITPVATDLTHVQGCQGGWRTSIRLLRRRAAWQGGPCSRQVCLQARLLSNSTTACRYTASELQ
jgi:hypothetical protein